jgi:hypothetical protein
VIPLQHVVLFPDELFACRSAESNEDLQPSTTNGGGHVGERETPHAQQGQWEANPVAPAMEQPTATESVAPTVQEPPVTGPTSPGGGAHNEGDLSDEGLWSAAVTSSDPARAGAGAMRDAPGNAAWDPPMVAEKATAPAASTAGVRLGRPIRVQ